MKSEPSFFLTAFVTSATPLSTSSFAVILSIASSLPRFKGKQQQKSYLLTKEFRSQPSSYSVTKKFGLSRRLYSKSSAYWAAGPRSLLSSILYQLQFGIFCMSRSPNTDISCSVKEHSVAYRRSRKRPICCLRFSFYAESQKPSQAMEYPLQPNPKSQPSSLTARLEPGDPAD